MADTYTQIYIQVVFAVSGRQNLISKDHKEEIHRYITGIVRNNSQKLIAVNSMPDHLHMPVGLQPDMALSDLVRDVKANTSNFINERRLVRGKFSWREGFGAFSYSHSQLGAVIRYTQNQEQHHKQRSFRDEYLEMLKKFDVAFDSKYIFDLVED